MNCPYSLPEDRRPRVSLILFHKTFINQSAGNLARTSRAVENVSLKFLESSRSHFEKAMQSGNDTFAAFTLGCDGPVATDTRRNCQDRCIAALGGIGLFFLAKTVRYNTNFGDIISRTRRPSS